MHAHRPGEAKVLRRIDDWGVSFVAAAIVAAEGVVERRGETGRAVRIASVTKPLLARAVAVAVEEGTLALDTPAGPPFSTVRHLLAHAGGYGFDGPQVLARPGTRRIYSNTGFERLGSVLAVRSDMDVGEYLHDAVFGPLEMTSSQLRGSPAKDVWSTVDDLARFARELLRPELVAPATANEFATVQFPELAGILPDVGRFDPNPWGLGVEIRGTKAPHWTGTANSPQTFGHYGGSGTFMWVDPRIGRALVVLTDRPFGPWALTEWPRLSDDVVAASPMSRSASGERRHVP